MRICRALIVALLFVPLAGCVPVLSINRWYTENTSTSDLRLTGTWHPVGSDGNPENARFTFVPADNAYTLSLAEADHLDLVQTFSVHLFRVDGQLFLDASENGNSYQGRNLDFGGFMIPAHMVGKVMIDNDRLSIQFLDDEWVAKALKSNSDLIRHERSGDMLFLTAPTPDLERFLSTCAKEKAFSVAVELRRN